MSEMPDVLTLTTISSDWGNDIRDRTIQRYSSVANRTTEHPSPTEGDLSYLEDSNTVWVYSGAAWIPLLSADQLFSIASFEVDGSTEVASFSVGTTAVTVASVTLAIPAGWGSWKCAAHATWTSGANDMLARIRIDGTDQQEVGTASTHPGAVGGRRTGMTTTGNRTVELRMRRSAASADTVLDFYLYARAVRTS